MLTDKELIEAQEQDIKNLTIKLNTLWSEITALKINQMKKRYLVINLEYHIFV